jgi:hypothetical protein
MRWSKRGAMVPTTLLDAASLHYSIKPICTCGNSARFESHGLWWHFERRGWDDRLIEARLRFWCRICRSKDRKKVRPRALEVVPWLAGDIELPWPDERVWKRAMARVR